MTPAGPEPRDVQLGSASAGVHERVDVAAPGDLGAQIPLQGGLRRPLRSANTWVERKYPLTPRVVLPTRPEPGAFAQKPHAQLRPQMPSPYRTGLEWVSVLGGALLAALLIKLFLFQAFLIPSASMVTTLEIGNRVLVNKLSYRMNELHRGEVVVFHRPAAAASEDNSDLIKRVIGLPGDSIDCSNGLVLINGVPLDEPWLPRQLPTDNCGGPKVVGANEFFAMGDNRPFSRDSRSFGMVDQDLIVGRAFILIWPFNRIGQL